MIIQIKLTRSENCARFGVSPGTIVKLDMETEYLPVVVASEVYENNSRTPMEAKKAQAIAARTYVTGHTRNGIIIDDTANYQAYKYRDPATIPNSIAACQATSGQVLCYGGDLITAWYSNSNGGSTKRSDEAWSTYKPWTIVQDDPWDIAGRAKWGDCKASHCVGMSQIGAAYAAFAGVSCAGILDFYYPGTRIVTQYGAGEEVEYLPEKTNIGLVVWAKNLIGNPYWYGTAGYKCTESLLKRKAEQYPSYYSESRMARYRQDIAKKKICSDCIGLMKGYLWDQGDGTAKYDKTTDVNTSGLYDRASIKGTIDTLPEVPGLMVYKTGHVGVYEGGGYVIEAKGFASGVVRSKRTDTAWTHWIAVPWISYAGYEMLISGGPEAFPYQAQVTTKTTPLNIWDAPSKNKSYMQVAKGDSLTVVGHGDAIGWYRVDKDGVTGQSDGQYLTRIASAEKAEEGGEMSGDEDPNETGHLYTVTLPAVSVTVKDAVLDIYPGALVYPVNAGGNR